MRSKSKTTDDTTFDRRRSSAALAGEEPARRRTDRPATHDRVSPLEVADPADVRPRKRRSTRDGRQPLVVYMQPEAIKAVKIAALEYDTTASSIVADAVASWLRTRPKRKRT